MICCVSQIDSFWKTFVLSNDCESSMRAIVIEPPRFGVASVARSPRGRAEAGIARRGRAARRPTCEASTPYLRALPQDSCPRLSHSGRRQRRVPGPIRRSQWPPSIESTWPVTQDDSSATKKRTPLAMSSGVPEAARRDPLDQRSLAFLAVALPLRDRSSGSRARSPARSQFTVIPKRPSSCAVCRVKPICPAFALAYAWIPVRLTLRPAPEEMLTMRPYARRLHAGNDRPRADERAGQVRVDDRVPVVVRDVLERLADLADDTAGVVDEDVDAADPLDELVHLSRRR